jgi:hypothetical protein
MVRTSFDFDVIGGPAPRRPATGTDPHESAGAPPTPCAQDQVIDAVPPRDAPAGP